jgi:hypothetical protein
MRAAFRYPCTCNRSSLLAGTAPGRRVARAANAAAILCANTTVSRTRPRSPHCPCGFQSAARDSLFRSVGLSAARLPHRTGGHGPREAGQSRARGHRSAVGACQHCPRSVHTASTYRKAFKPSSRSPRRAACGGGGTDGDRGGGDSTGCTDGSADSAAAQAAGVQPALSGGLERAVGRNVLESRIASCSH